MIASRRDRLPRIELMANDYLPTMAGSTGSAMSAPKLRITHLRGSMAGRVQELDSAGGPFNVGRHQESGVRYDHTADFLVSTRHGQFVFEQDKWWFADTRSTNGTFLGLQRLQDRVALASGQEFSLGSPGAAGGASFRVEVITTSDAEPAGDESFGDGAFAQEPPESEVMTTFSCAHCGASNVASGERAGQSVACVRCGQQTRVPQGKSAAPVPGHAGGFAPGSFGAGPAVGSTGPGGTAPGVVSRGAPPASQVFLAPEPEDFPADGAFAAPALGQPPPPEEISIPPMSVPAPDHAGGFAPGSSGTGSSGSGSSGSGSSGSGGTAPGVSAWDAPVAFDAPEPEPVAAPPIDYAPPPIEYSAPPASSSRPSASYPATEAREAPELATSKPVTSTPVTSTPVTSKPVTSSPFSGADIPVGPEPVKAPTPDHAGGFAPGSFGAGPAVGSTGSGGTAPGVSGGALTPPPVITAPPVVALPSAAATAPSSPSPTAPAQAAAPWEPPVMTEPAAPSGAPSGGATPSATPGPPVGEQGFFGGLIGGIKGKIDRRRERKELQRDVATLEQQLPQLEAAARQACGALGEELWRTGSQQMSRFPAAAILANADKAVAVVSDRQKAVDQEFGQRTNEYNEWLAEWQETASTLEGELNAADESLAAAGAELNSATEAITLAWSAKASAASEIADRLKRVADEAKTLASNDLWPRFVEAVDESKRQAEGLTEPIAGLDDLHAARSAAATKVDAALASQADAMSSAQEHRKERDEMDAARAEVARAYEKATADHQAETDRARQPVPAAHGDLGRQYVDAPDAPPIDAGSLASARDAVRRLVEVQQTIDQKRHRLTELDQA